MTYPAPDAKVVTAPPTATIPVTAQGTSGQVLPVASEPSIAVQGSGAILPSAKKVRTVTIRPDMSIVPNSAARVAEPEPPPAAQPESPATAASPQQDAAPAPSPAPTPARPTPPPQVANAPLSLSPDTVSSVPAQQAPARAASPGATEQPVALATAPAAGGDTPPATTDGRYTVQVSSQRSEAEAEAAYRTLQARYPNVLGEQPSFVRRADLGNRGIYYRTLVGPFATAEQAGQLCSALKAAGGQCIIHRN